MTPQLPVGVTAYKRTATFDQSSVPAGLLQDHSTREGTWGVLRLESGRLRYVVTDPRRPPCHALLTPDTPEIVIEPTIVHHVELLGPVEFHVEFYRTTAIQACR